MDLLAGFGVFGPFVRKDGEGFCFGGFCAGTVQVEFFDENEDDKEGKGAGAGVDNDGGRW